MRFGGDQVTEPGSRVGLRRLAAQAMRRRSLAVAVVQEKCGLCAAARGAEHRRLLGRPAGALHCAGGACALLFDRSAAGSSHYRLIPQRYRSLAGAGLDDDAWSALRVPVGIAFLVRST